MGVLYKLDSAPAVHRYIDNEPVTSQEQFRNVIAVICGQYCEKVIGRWPVVRKADTMFVGWARLKMEDVDIHGYGPYLSWYWLNLTFEQ